MWSQQVGGRPRGLRMEVRGAWHAHYITAWKGGDSSVPLAQRALNDGGTAIGRPMGARGLGGTGSVGIGLTDRGASVRGFTPTGVRR